MIIITVIIIDPTMYVRAYVLRFDVPSGVKDQPFGDDETIIGATNRAHNAAIAYHQV
jgi:non-canonical (house-cleaning) NTP pyrophosphatase